MEEDVNASDPISQLEASPQLHHLFSRHSAIGRMQLADEDTNVPMRSADIRAADAPGSRFGPAEVANEMPQMATVQDTSDFDISNAFEGAFGDLDLSLNGMYWNSNIWLIDFTANNHNLHIHGMDERCLTNAPQ